MAGFWKLAVPTPSDQVRSGPEIVVILVIASRTTKVSVQLMLGMFDTTKQIAALNAAVRQRVISSR